MKSLDTTIRIFEFCDVCGRFGNAPSVGTEGVVRASGALIQHRTSASVVGIEVMQPLVVHRGSWVFKISVEIDNAKVLQIKHPIGSAQLEYS